MKISIIMTALAALVAAVAASASTPINGTDRANAARACTALRTGNASAFGQQYATFGACTSQWAQKAHTARLAAQRACTAKGLTGKKYSACVKAATNTTLATQTALTKSAEKTCAAERKAIGDAAFAKKYGSNANMRNAFMRRSRLRSCSSVTRLPLPRRPLRVSCERWAPRSTHARSHMS